MQLFNRAISYAKPYKSTFVIAIVFNILYAFFNLISLGFMAPVLSILFDEKYEAIKNLPVYSGKFLDFKEYLSNSASYYMQNLKEDLGPEILLLYFSIGFLLAFLIRNIFSYFSEYFLVDLRSGVSRDFRKAIHTKILKLPSSYFSETKKGDFIARISSDVSVIESSILNALVDIVRSPIMIIVFFTFLFFINTKLTLFTLVVFPIMGTLISLIGKSLKKNAGRAQNEFGKIMSYVDETLSYNKIIKIFNAEEKIKKRFDDSLDVFRFLTQKVLKRNAMASPVSEFLGGITITLLVYFGGRLSLEGEGLKGSVFIVYIGLFYTMLDPIKKFAKALSDIQKGEVSAKRIFDVLDTDESIKDVPDAIEVDSIHKEIVFENVSFKYENQWIFKNFTLSIPKGKKVALVGESGSGKSTLANLLTRFYDVESGRITLDGVDIKKIKLGSYRALFGMVTQESILFNDTIANNIGLSTQKIDLDTVIKAAKIANANQFIEEQEKGYNTIVGEGGGKLSGGQKQRLSIARAVYKNPPIMVLDEATSALDSQSEQLVQSALEHLMESRTSLVIAHRLSTIQNSDIIVVLDKGKIVEQGSHEELIQKKGAYYNYIQIQSIQES